MTEAVWQLSQANLAAGQQPGANTKTANRLMAHHFGTIVAMRTSLTPSTSAKPIFRMLNSCCLSLHLGKKHL